MSPLPAKVLSHFGLLLKAEAAYNTYLAPAAATDGLAIIDAPECAVDYVDNGERGGAAAGSVGGLKRAAKSGRFLSVPAVMQPVGYGSVIDATKLPNIHTLLRMAGYGLTTDLTAEAEKHTYLTENAVAVTPFSASGKAYYGGEEYLFSGGLVDEYTLEVVNGGIPKFSATIFGAMTQGLQTDLALPAITYGVPQTNMPVKANGLSWTLGGVTPTKVKSCTVTDKRNLGALMLDNSTGNHSGWVPGRERLIQIVATIEAQALATMNAYNIAELATAAAFSMNIGGNAQYSRYKIEADTLQIDDVQKGDENNARTWELTMTAKPSTLTAYDMLRWIFD